MKRTLPTGISELRELLKQEILALVIVPAWDNRGMHSSKETRAKMTLGLLDKNHLSPYFIGVNLAGSVGTYSKVVYAPNDRSRHVRNLVDEQINILTGIDVEFNWEGCHRWDMTHAMTQLLEFGDMHSRFLFLVSEQYNDLLKMLRTIFPYIPKSAEISLPNPGECFVLYPAARYIEVINLPGLQF